MNVIEIPGVPERKPYVMNYLFLKRERGLMHVLPLLGEDCCHC